MKPKGQHFIVYLLLFFILGIVKLTLFTQTAQALTADDKDAINSAPDGLIIQKYFTNQEKTSSDFSNGQYPFRHNYAKVDDTGKVLILADGPRTGEREITTKTYPLVGTFNTQIIQNTSSYGAIWSDKAAQNYIDPTKKQTVSAWIYMGKSSNEPSVNGNGIALVIQNDPLGTKAIGAGLQGLGVYGYDGAISKSAALIGMSADPATPTEVAKTAIQNSIALEFDPQINRIKDKDLKKLTLYNGGNLSVGDNGESATIFYNTINGYDTSVGNQYVPEGYPNRYDEGTKIGSGGGFGHIALTYPANPQTYVNVTKNSDFSNESAFWSPFESFYSQIHTNTIETSLTNDKDLNGNKLMWHHLSMTWTPSEDKKTITIDYSFNDKNLDGTINYNYNGQLNKYSFIRIDKSVKVDMSTFGDIKDNKLLWGFTGSNSNNSDVQGKLAIFESIPALVSIQPDIYIKDNTLNKIITDNKNDTHYTTDKTVNSGDDLTINYNLTYLSGRTNWSDIVASINLPDNIDFSGNDNIATITFENGETELVSANQLNNNTVNYKINHELSLDNKVMNVAINGKAVNETPQDILVTTKAAKFSSDNNITTLSTPEFTIKYKKDWKLVLSSEKQNINLLKPDDNTIPTLNLDTTLNYDYKIEHDFEVDDPIIYNIKIRDKSYSTATSISEAGKTAVHEIPLSKIVSEDDFWELFPVGETTEVQVTAMDKDSIFSNTYSYYVTIQPNKSVELVADPQLTFQTTQSVDLHKILKRQSDFDLTVISHNSDWKLYGQASELNNSDSNFNGNVIYVDDNDKIFDMAQNTFIDENLTDTTGSYDITDDWASDEGVLLNQSGINKSGQYSGKIQWTVSNSI